MSADSLDALKSIIPVSRETGGRLTAFVDLLRKWQRTHNLIGQATLDRVWSRHVADSAQLFRLAPDARRWVDLGSGAGLPGLVIAILIAGREGARVDLVESDSRKAAFLRAAIRETSAPAVVHAARIESVAEQWPESPDVVTARALAPMPRLLPLAAPFLWGGGVGLFHKGQDVEEELREAAKSWAFSTEKHASLIEPRSWIVEIRDLKRRTAG